MMFVIAWILAAALAWLALCLAYLGIRGLRARPDGLRERARADLADWAEQLEANPSYADLLRRPAVLSRYLSHTLGRPDLSRRELRRRAWKTLWYLDGWWGAFELNRLARDCIAWSLIGPGDAGGPGRGSGGPASGR
ncbi:hypothetical protein TA3x_000086 [Tundrisphaera sp. TA3]|uniref:hypothetical protein n=1 Tax=Tundrisphaera sp. TA3 TaxID=3435775 RepID=UPI003EBB09DF